jgi:hypothetical protein
VVYTEQNESVLRRYSKEETHPPDFILLNNASRMNQQYDTDATMQLPQCQQDHKFFRISFIELEAIESTIIITPLVQCLPLSLTQNSV